MSDQEIYNKICNDKDYRDCMIMLFKLPPDVRELIMYEIQWRYDHQKEHARKRFKVVR